MISKRLFTLSVLELARSGSWQVVIVTAPLSRC
jgi:hypothetical protein